MIDQNVCDAARMGDQERPIGALEEKVLCALEEHDVAHAAWTATRKEMGQLFERVLSAWLYPDAVVEIHSRSRGQPRCLWIVRVGSGNARNATRFRILSAPSVTVDPAGDPAFSDWSVRAVAISGKTGREMSGNTANRRTTTDGSVTLTGHVFREGFSELSGEALQQLERDAFIRMVAEAETILAARGQEARGHGQQSSSTSEST